MSSGFVKARGGPWSAVPFGGSMKTCSFVWMSRRRCAKKKEAYDEQKPRVLLLYAPRRMLQS